MSTTIEPFIFSDEENGFQLNPEQLPGAVESSEEKEETKPNEGADKTEKLESKPFNKGEEVESEDNEKEEEVSKESPFFSEKEEKAEDDKITSDKVDYKSLADYFIEKGLWKDFDGRENFEFTEDSFQYLLEEQVKNQVQERIFEEKSQFGQTANELIEYLKSGGTVEQYTQYYTQQVEIESIDINETEGQEKVLREYYKSLDYPESKIKKKIDSLKDLGDDELKEEAEFAKVKLVEVIEEERQELVAEQEAMARERKLQVEFFNKAVRKEIHEDNSLPEREKKDLDKFVYEYRHQDQNGNKYSDFMVKMSEIQREPKKYAKFLKIVKNFDSYQEPKEVEKKAKKEVLSFLKAGGNPLQGAQSQEPVKQRVYKPQPFSFKD
jgi:hypothetical protein